MSAYDLSGSNYSEVDASNNNAAPGGMPEGMAPSGVNDAGRSLMASVKRAYDWDHAGTWATVGGSANAVTLTYPVAPAAYAQGQKHCFKATAANTSTTTVNVNSLGAKNVFKKTGSGAAACAGGEIQSGDLVEIEYDGTQFQILCAANQGYAESFATIASATTTNIGASSASYLQVTGTTAITAFDTVLAGTTKRLEFAGALTLTHSGTALILPGAASITTAAGDVAIMVSEGSGNWRCVNYMRASGLAIVSQPLSKPEYAPADQTITAAGSLTLAHGFGIRPKLIVLTLVNVTTEGGYSPGAEVDLVPYSDASGGRGAAVVRDSTNIAIKFGADASPLLVVSSSGNAFAITPAKWNLRVRAYA